MYNVEILEDSIGPCDNRITTWELTYPRFVHAELMTHRLFSRNSASSRAIPTKKLIERIEADPVLPKWWGKNQSGMQAREELGEYEKREAKDVWLRARDAAIKFVHELEELGLHKQITNRLVEPWMFITVLMTSTEHDNWFHLRDHPDAQPELQWVAHEMHEQYKKHTPKRLKTGEWHIPLVDAFERKELPLEEILKVATGRCARVSYLTHHGVRDMKEDIALHDKLLLSGHWSPFEHVAQALATSARSGNFIGWRQYRKMFDHEHYGKRLP